MGLKVLPTESGNIACITCHYTHGSPKHSLLRIQDAATPENRLCLQCHQQDKFMQGGAGSHGGFVQNQGRCSDCHNMHSKANKKLLQESTESVLCEKCHASSGISKFNVWKGYSSGLTSSVMKGTGGSFGLYSGERGGNAHSMHRINDEATPAPGGVTTQHRCGTCHNPHGTKQPAMVLDDFSLKTFSVLTNQSINPSYRWLGSTRYTTTRCTQACHSSGNASGTAGTKWYREPTSLSTVFGIPLGLKAVPLP